MTQHKDTNEKFELNLSRIDDLIKVYRKIETPSDKGYERDVLRAAVVSMTAMLEDLIRDAFARKLGEGIAASHPNGSKPLTADAVKSAARDGLLEVKKWPREEELYDVLYRKHKGKGFPPWPKLFDELLKRRNDIAHRGDRDATTGVLTTIEILKVKQWRDAVECFGEALLAKM